jgi:hypothetical protein
VRPEIFLLDPAEETDLLRRKIAQYIEAAQMDMRPFRDVQAAVLELGKAGRVGREPVAVLIGPMCKSP